jgi:cytochrome c-type biogenesis protein CcmE
VIAELLLIIVIVIVCVVVVVDVFVVFAVDDNTSFFRLHSSKAVPSYLSNTRESV